MRSRRRFAARGAALLSAVALTLGSASAPAAAQDDYPSRPIRIVIPLATGGNVDLLSRLIAEKMSAAWGQPVIVESKPGANTMLATTAVANAKPDGYTLLFTISGFVQNLVLQANPPYKMQDLAPVSMVALFPIAMAVGGSSNLRTLADLIALSKKDPGKLSYGSYGVGSGGHIIGEGLNKTSGAGLTHVAYKGEAASFPDLVGGQIVAAFGSVGFYARQVGSGKARLIAIASPARLKEFPDVPTFAESGYPQVNLPGWGGMFVPAGTPPQIVAKLSDEIRRIVALPEVRTRILEMGFEPNAGGGAEFAQHLQNDLSRWSAVVKENGIKLD